MRKSIYLLKTTPSSHTHRFHPLPLATPTSRLEIIMLKILAIILFPNSFFPLLLFSYYSAIILILFSNLINI